MAFYNLLQNLIWLYDLKFTKFTFVILENLILGWWFGYSRNCSLSVRQKLVKGDLIYSKWLNFFTNRTFLPVFFHWLRILTNFFNLLILVNTGFFQQVIGLHFRLSLSKIINNIDFTFEPKMNTSKKIM